MPVVETKVVPKAQIIYEPVVVPMPKPVTETPVVDDRPSQSELAICDELRADLPTASEDDTPETLDEIADLYDTFDAVCGPA